jgi:hypothetical protein
MAALHDQQNLLIPESMDRLVGPTDMGEDREILGLLVEQDRVVRGDQLGARAADQDPPGVLSD